MHYPPKLYHHCREFACNYAGIVRVDTIAGVRRMKSEITSFRSGEFSKRGPGLKAFVLLALRSLSAISSVQKRPPIVCLLVL